MKQWIDEAVDLWIDEGAEFLGFFPNFWSADGLGNF